MTARTRLGPTAVVQVRPARLADAEAICRIYNRAVVASTATFDTEPRTVAEERRRLKDPDFPILVAERRGRVVGWASLSPWSSRKAYARTAETSVYVDAASRGRGIGRRLLAQLLQIARHRGFRTLLARVSEESVPSLHLHASLGFRPVGVMHEVGFKFGRWLDVHLLERPLVPRRAASRTDASRSPRRTLPPRRTGPRTARRAR